MEARAVAKHIGISPKKLRPVAESMRGRKVEDATALLDLAPSPSARALAKVIRAAAANAENNFQVSPSDQKITRILIDSGAIMKRMRPQARGRVNPIRRHSSHITVVVEEEG